MPLGCSGERTKRHHHRAGDEQADTDRSTEGDHRQESEQPRGARSGRLLTCIEGCLGLPRDVDLQLAQRLEPLGGRRRPGVDGRAQWRRVDAGATRSASIDERVDGQIGGATGLRAERVAQRGRQVGVGRCEHEAELAVTILECLFDFAQLGHRRVELSDRHHASADGENPCRRRLVAEQGVVREQLHLRIAACAGERGVRPRRRPAHRRAGHRRRRPSRHRLHHRRPGCAPRPDRRCAPGPCGGSRRNGPRRGSRRAPRQSRTGPRRRR